MKEYQTASTLSRRRLLRATLVACGGGGNSPATTPGGAASATAVPTNTVVPAATSPSATVGAASTMATQPPAASPSAAGSPMATDGRIPSPAPGVPDAYTKAPMTFKSVATVPGKGSKVTTFQISYLPPITPRAQNQYWQEFERRLGVTLEPNLVPAGAYAEKLSALTASGDIADLTCVILANEPGQNKVIQQGGYTDLTPYLTGDAIKEFPNLALFPQRVWKNVAINGKIYGVPRPDLGSGAPLFFRQDWAEKVSDPLPKNADQFFQVMADFTQKDPDGNGQNDTYGLTSFGTNLFAIGFFQQMFRTPNGWRLNGDGTLTNTIETEEFKATVTFMRKLFAAGLYHPNTATMTNSEAKENFKSGKVGAYTDGIVALPGVSGMRALTQQVTPTAKVIGLVPPGYDGGKAVAHTGPGFFGFVAISAKAGRDKERVKELLRILDYWSAPFGSEEYDFVNNGIKGVHYEIKPDGTFVKTPQSDKDIGSFFNLANAPLVFYYPGAPDDAVYMQGLIRDMAAIGLDDPTFGLVSLTGIAKAGELSQLRTDRIGGVVSGREPLTALDQYVRDWRSRGGDQIRKELEDALKAR